MLQAKEALLQSRLEAALIRKPKGIAFIKKHGSSNFMQELIMGDQTPRAGSPILNSSFFNLRSLPWKTKVHDREFENFFQKERCCFV